MLSLSPKYILLALAFLHSATSQDTPPKYATEINKVAVALSKIPSSVKKYESSVREESFGYALVQAGSHEAGTLLSDAYSRLPHVGTGATPISHDACLAIGRAVVTPSFQKAIQAAAAALRQTDFQCQGEMEIYPKRKAYLKTLYNNVRINLQNYRYRYTMNCPEARDPLLSAEVNLVFTTSARAFGLVVSEYGNPKVVCLR